MIESSLWIDQFMYGNRRPIFILEKGLKVYKIKLNLRHQKADVAQG